MCSHKIKSESRIALKTFGWCGALQDKSWQWSIQFVAILGQEKQQKKSLFNSWFLIFNLVLMKRTRLTPAYFLKHLLGARVAEWKLLSIGVMKGGRNLWHFLCFLSHLSKNNTRFPTHENWESPSLWLIKLQDSLHCEKQFIFQFSGRIKRKRGKKSDPQNLD